MSQFMQELVSFISIMLGVVVLTAWVMWILLRPSGDSKAQEFASKSARDGQTLAVMENNELKNKVARLERELKVLMSAGYGKNVGERIEGKGEGLRIQDEKTRGKGKGERLGAKGEGQKVKNKRSRSVAPGAMSLDERSRIKDNKSKVKGERIEGKGERGKGKEEGLKIKGVQPKVQKEGRKVEGERIEAKDEGLRIQDEKTRGKVKGERIEGKGERLKIKDVPPKVRKKGRKVEGVVVAAKKPVVEKITDEVVAPKHVETTRPSQVLPLSEAQRRTETTDKKKVADFLTSVAETTELQRKKVEALDEENEALEEVSRYPDNDLKKIKGIGSHLERKLKKAGIRSYRQISDFSEDDIRHVSMVIGSYPRRIRREAWVEQAKVLVSRRPKD